MKEIIIFCLLALFVATPLFSQNADNDKNAAKEKKQGKEAAAIEESAGSDGLDPVALKAEIEALKEKIDSLQRLCNVLDVDLEKTDSMLKAERNRWRSAGMKNRIKEMNKKNSASRTRLGNMTDSLKNDYWSRLDELARKDSVNTDSISVLNDRLNAFGDFRNKWMIGLADSIVGSFMEKGYLAVEVSELEELFARYNELAGKDSATMAARDSLGRFIEEYKLFVKGTGAVNAPYDQELVNSLIVPMQKLRDATPDGVRKKELVNLARRLFNYDVTVEMFEEIVAEIDDAVKKNAAGEHAVVYPVVEKILKRQVEEEIVVEIEDIPWLKTRYAEYCRMLKENCIEPITVQLRKK